MDQQMRAEMTTGIRERRRPGVLKHRQMGYWEPDYGSVDANILVVFRMNLQDSVDQEEAAAAVAGACSTATCLDFEPRPEVIRYQGGGQTADYTLGSHMTARAPQPAAGI